MSEEMDVSTSNKTKEEDHVRVSRLYKVVIIAGLAEILALCGIIFSGADYVTGLMNNYLEAQAKSTEISILSSQLAIQERIATTQAEEILLEDPSLATQIASAIVPLVTAKAEFEEKSNSSAPSNDALTEIPATETEPSINFRSFNQEFEDDGIIIYMQNDITLTSDQIRLGVVVANERSSQYVLRFRPDAFSLTDDLGNSYPLYLRNEDDRRRTYQASIQPSKDYYISFTRPVRFDSIDLGWFQGPIDIDASYLIFTIDSLAGMNPIAWKYDLR